MMIVTTIQKMANAVKNPKYTTVMDVYKDKKVVFIIDECHRSQFESMRAQIEKHFKRANYIGFTGTPIFEENKGTDSHTTADVYAKRIDVDKFAHVADMNQIIENGYNLNIPKYVDTFEEEEPVNLDSVKAQIKTLDSETKATIDKAESFIRQLGL